ncbi:MAG: sigma-70 family RNA polymerase sigma factor, partial [Nitrospirae bacterium]|nr:sigma-70 family RNA polymerase sigma factor [Nitrospirota bacterium]
MEKRSQFEEKVLGLLNELFGVALRLAKNRDDAEDLVAETITKAWLNRLDLKDPQRFRSWIFRILSNTFISDCRKKSTRPQTEPFTDSYSEESENFSIFEKLHQPFLLWWSNPKKEFLNKILREDLEKAVDSLPENFRIVVVLSDMEGFSYKEIAGI